LDNAAITITGIIDWWLLGRKAINSEV